MADPGGKSIKVLSIDGGVVRGTIAAVIQREHLQRVGRPAHETFHLIAGTSTGRIIALGLGTPSKNGEPCSPQELLDLYVQNGAEIFKKGHRTFVKQVCRPKYAAKALESVLSKYFGKTRIDSALVPLLISSYDLRGQLPFFFKSCAFNEVEKIDWNVTDIARATSAAPRFFPPKHLTWGTGDFALVDGGVYDNNPAMARMRKRAVFIQTRRNLSWWPWEPATVRTILVISRPNIGACWAGLPRSFPSLWIAYRRRWTMN